MSGFWNFTVANFRMFMRDYQTVFWIFLFPILFMSLLGVAFGAINDVTFNVAVIDNDQTDISEMYIESIDEAVEKLDRSLEGASENLKVPPETEFWGHCSNMQVWAEYNYDTRLLHSNLAFPLLKRLYEAGDTIAQRVFQEEIVLG